MKIKIEGSFIETSEVPHGITEELLKDKHNNKYKIQNIYSVKGEREKIDILVKCEIHGWFAITKKAFKKGSGCKECSREKKNKKISETLKKQHVKNNGGEEYIKKQCVCCGEDFLVRNVKKQLKKQTCSDTCYKKLVSNNLTERNKTVEFRKRRSEKMKYEYASGTRDPGKTYAPWVQYKKIKVQGNYELEICKALDLLKKDKKILDWEYTNDRYPYLKLGRTVSTYILDFKVYVTRNVFFYIESKGLTRLNDLYKWKRISSSYPLKVFLYNELKEIQNNPDYILNKKTISQKEIDRNIVELKTVKKDFNNTLYEDLIPF